ncbi:MAG: hypothetical protein WCJ09_27535 [Planctomycetota bacterium]
MPLPRPPGVYFERADSPIGAVDEVRSDVAGFIGIAERGPLNVPVCVQNWTQFQTRFGRSGLDYAHLPDAIRGFFANGGRTAWVVRVGCPVDKFDHASLCLVDDQGRALFRIWAQDPGFGGATISVRVLPAVRNRFHLAIIVPNDTGKRETLETWRDLESNSRLTNSTGDNDRYVAKPINGWKRAKPPKDRKPDASISTGSVLIVVEDLRSPNDQAPAAIVGVQASKSYDDHGAAVLETRQEGFLSWNRDFVSASRRSVLSGMTRENFVSDGLEALEKIDDVAIVAIPDLMWRSRPKTRRETPPPSCIPVPEPMEPPPPAEQRIPFTPFERQQSQLEVLAHCSRMRNRFAILDAPAESDPVTVQQ